MSILNQLKSNSEETKYIEYTDMIGETNKVFFQWNEPASMDEIKNYEKKYNIIIPGEYKNFLLMSNGAMIYGDEYHGGYHLLSLDEMFKVTIDHKEWGYELDDSWIIFVECMFSSDIMLFDLKNINSNKCIIDGDLGYPKDEWKYLIGGFDQMMVNLYMCNGSMYWRW